MGDSHVGLQARLLSQALRKLTATLNKSDTIAIFINQLREKIGVLYGSPETTPGGRALKFYSSVRLDIRRIESIKSGAEVIGKGGDVAPADRAYLARIVSERTGLGQADAEKRVSDTITKAKQAADDARHGLGPLPAFRIHPWPGWFAGRPWSSPGSAGPEWH